MVSFRFFASRRGSCWETGYKGNMEPKKPGSSWKGIGMRREAMILMTLLVGGCATVQSVSRGATLILKPQVMAGSHTQTVLNPYDQSAINHLTLEVFPVVAGVPQAKVAGQTLLNAQLDNPVVFFNLKANTQYRIQASAYYSADDTQLISIPASSSVDISVLSDDRPTLGNLKVQLMDRLFSGQATSSLNIISGGYSAVASVSSGLASSIAGYVSTFAGSSAVQAPQDGTGLGARFCMIQMMTYGNDGNLYLADDGNSTIRKVTLSGVVTTIAGTQSAGVVDGTGTNARLNGPHAIVLDRTTGNFYVSDFYGAAIRKVTPAGVVTTVAGNGTAGYVNETGGNARFNHPAGMVIDAAGNLYVCDNHNHAIRRITPAGVVTTFAGNGTAGHVDANGASARFHGPEGMAIDAVGNLFVTDFAGHCIRKVTPSGDVSTVAGTYGTAGTADGAASVAKFSSPHGVAVDPSGNLYVTDFGNVRVRKVSSSGVVTTIAGGGPVGVNGLGTQAGFSGPRHPYLTPDGILYIGDNGALRRIQ